MLMMAVKLVLVVVLIKTYSTLGLRICVEFRRDGGRLL